MKELVSTQKKTQMTLSFPITYLIDCCCLIDKLFCSYAHNLWFTRKNLLKIDYD